MTKTDAIRFRRLCRRAERALYIYAGAATALRSSATLANQELRDLMRDLDRALKPKRKKAQ